MNNDLIHQRCYNHARREAVARCPECGRYFCRECVTEHEDRVLCASCLLKLTGIRMQKRAPLAAAGRIVLVALGVITLWFFFYVIGRGLLAMPSSFHEGAVWRADTWSDSWDDSWDNGRKDIRDDKQDDRKDDGQVKTKAQ